MSTGSQKTANVLSEVNDMYDMTTTILTYIPWVTMFLYCVVTPIVGLADEDKLIYPLGASTLSAIAGLVVLAINMTGVQ